MHLKLLATISRDQTNSITTAHHVRNPAMYFSFRWSLIVIVSSALYNVSGTFRSFTLSRIIKATASLSAAVFIGNPQLTLAASGPNDVVCQVTLPATASAIYGQGTESAIYLTAKQDVGIWQAQVRNMKPPPILTSRTAAPFQFPLTITLNGQTDLTPEGLGLQSQWQSGKVPLVISARLDVDGVAATRNAEDLIGKAIVSKDGSGTWSGCNIELEDRGIGGRIVTKTLK
jgi:hypothetical protein